MTNCELVDNRIGISIPVGTATVTATSISDNEATEAASDHGISIGDAVFVATDVTITGQDIAGFNAHGVGGEPESRMAVDLADMVIEGGQRGVRLGGFVDDGHFAMHSSEVSGQTVSAVDIGLFDLAYVDLTGGNRLSVVSGFALEDTRFDPNFVFIEARGILLNGRTYTGLVEGTASVPPDYRIIARNGGIQF